MSEITDEWFRVNFKEKATESFVVIVKHFVLILFRSLLTDLSSNDAICNARNPPSICAMGIFHLFLIDFCLHIFLSLF